MSDAYGSSRPSRSTTRQTSRGRQAAAERHAPKAAARGTNGSAKATEPARPTLPAIPEGSRLWRIASATSVRTNQWEYEGSPPKLTGDPKYVVDPWAIDGTDDAAHRVRMFAAIEFGNNGSAVYRGSREFNARFSAIQPLATGAIVLAYPVEFPAQGGHDAGEVWIIIGEFNDATLCP